MSRLFIRGGLVSDPGQGLDGVPRTLVIEAGRISAIIEGAGEPALRPGQQIADEVIDARGLWVLPGLIDLHTHLREPGEEHKETFQSGGQAAVAGGFTTILAMANTQPATDSSARVAWVRDRSATQSPARVFTVGAVTVGLLGDTLTDADSLASAGAVALSDDGRPLLNAALVRRALEQARDVGLPLLAHEEELSLVGKGCMHEGATATRLGLAGVPGVAEEVMVRRDLALVELTGARLHLQHLSTAGALRALREAKARGLPVTAEAAPHHFTLTDQSVGCYDTNAKMNPPLRSERDRAAVQAALADGTLDAIATDHAPHGPIEKDTVFEAAANGVVGLETAFALGLALVEAGVLTRQRLIALFTSGPAAVIPAFGDLGTLRVGARADVTLVDPTERWVVDPAAFRSRSRNTPFRGRALTGRVIATLVGGVVVFSRREPLASGLHVAGD